MAISLYVLFVMLCILHATAQPCGSFTSGGFQFSASYCIPGVAPFFTGFPTSFMMRCNATGGLIRDGYATADCTGGVTSTLDMTTTAAVLPYQCGVTCGVTQTQFADAVCAVAGPAAVGSAANGARCNNGVMQTCDATDLIKYNYADSSCADNPALPDVTIQRTPLGACRSMNVFSNCIVANTTVLPITFGSKQTFTESLGLTCAASELQFVEEARIGICVPATGLTTYCGGSGGTVWQYWSQTSGGVIGCGTVLMYAQFVSTGECTGRIARQRPFFPISLNTSSTHTCTGPAFPPAIHFNGTDQYALVSVYRDATCNASMSSNLLYKTYVRADGTCERASASISWKRFCQADGSMRSERFASADCTGGSVVNMTAANGTCSSYVSGEAVTTKADIFMFVEFCGGMGVTSVQPDQAPGSQKFNTTAPSLAPSSSPSRGPSMTPSLSPSKTPSAGPSKSPSGSPSMSPSMSPSNAPSRSPSKSPSQTPSTSSPTVNPSTAPSSSPSRNPSANPSQGPSVTPTKSPSANPTKTPSSSPSNTPTTTPSTSSPSTNPSKFPSVTPTTSSPSTTPSSSPSMSPSSNPSKNPSNGPSVNPTRKPSTSPTKTPTTASRASKIGNPVFCIVLAAIVTVVASVN